MSPEDSLAASHSANRPTPQAKKIDTKYRAAISGDHDPSPHRLGFLAKCFLVEGVATTGLKG